MADDNKYDRSALRNLKLITILSRCLQAINRKEAPLLRKEGLSFSQFGVLELLYHKGSQTIGEIIEKTLATGGNMTVVINNLEKQGYIKRLSHPSDKRAYLIKLSKKGEVLISDLFIRHIENLNSILKPLSMNEKDILIELCRKLGKGIV